MPTKTNKTVHNKKRVLEALQKTLGIVTSACKMVDVSTTQFYHWIKTDEDFAQAVKMVDDVALDFAESKLLENIKGKKETSIIFYLKTKGKKRGYIEKQEIDHTTRGESLNLANESTEDLIKRAEAIKKLNE